MTAKPFRFKVGEIVRIPSLNTFGGVEKRSRRQQLYRLLILTPHQKIWWRERDLEAR